MMMVMMMTMMVKMTLTDLLSCSDITDVEGVVQNVKSLVIEVSNIGTLAIMVMIDGVN